jgi:gamma-glutamyl:cysteine ligase YbdK (ATP-grasp superfamily)
MFQFGIEHEVAFLNEKDKFVDFSCAKFADFNQIIEQLPTYPNDYLQLHMGDAGIRKKRWYIEGFERFADSGKIVDCLPKGIEIRTTINSTISSTIKELTESFCLLSKVAAQYGFSPVLISFNPYKTAFEPEPPLNDYEMQLIQQTYPEEQTASIYMVTYGPDLNLSMAGLSNESLIDIGKKLTYYSPYIVPFSYSSPFYQGNLWEGLSVRTFVRTGRRAASIVFVEKREKLLGGTPSLTKVARLPAEVGRIEFKAFDSCDDFSIYAGLLALLKGLVLDESLPGRATRPDPKKHQLSAQQGFDNQDIYAIASQVLQAAEHALGEDPDVNLLAPLKVILEKRETKAHQLIRDFQKLGSIEQVLKNTYSAFV